VALKTGVQEVVLTGGTHGRPLCLYLDGRLRVGSHDERRYHEALVHPAMNGPHTRVLILGGGDGLAAREVLTHPDAHRVDVVEHDPDLVRLARTDPPLSRLNGHAYDDPRLHVTIADAFRRLRETPPGTYDVMIADLPDPGITASTKLYSQEFYGLARRALRPGGRLVVHAGPVATRPRVFWTVETTIRAAGLRTTPYRTDGRGTGFTTGPDRTEDTSGAPRDWGFVLAGTGTRPTLTRDHEERPLGAPVEGVRASTLVHPRY
jgi:spermidine synthase